MFCCQIHNGQCFPGSEWLTNIMIALEIWHFSTQTYCMCACPAQLSSGQTCCCNLSLSGRKQRGLLMQRVAWAFDVKHNHSTLPASHTRNTHTPPETCTDTQTDMQHTACAHLHTRAYTLMKKTQSLCLLPVNRHGASILRCARFNRRAKTCCTAAAYLSGKFSL